MKKLSEKSSKRISSILIRYILLILAGLPNLYLFYLIFTPLTVYPTYFLFSLFFEEVYRSGSVMLINHCFSIEIIDACVAGSAYYLLLILNLSLPNIKIKKRLKMILLSFGILLILNILRIFLVGTIFTSGSNLVDITHKLFWYLLSTLFVIAIWFFEVKIFKIKEIPFYSDIKFLYKNIK